MKADPIRRLLPLLDIMFLLFGYLMIILLAARFHSQNQAPPPDSSPEAQQMVDAVLAGYPLEVFTVHHGPQMALTHRRLDDNGDVPAGSAQDPDMTIVAGLAADCLIIILSPPGLAGRFFTESIQDDLVNRFGAQRTVIMVQRPGGQ